jgi:neutral ceramidase
MGLINWFAVHATSLNNTNTLISGDNKGLASLFLEKEMNPNQPLGQVTRAFSIENLRRMNVCNDLF